MHTHRSLAPAILIPLLACLGLAACGGSSSSSSTTSTTNAANTSSTTGSSTSAPGGATAGPGGGRFAAMLACLQQNGIVLPPPKPGQARPLGGLVEGAGGGAGLPKGVTRAQLQAALAKCGGPNFRRGGFGGRARFANPALRAALAKFAVCMRQNGVNVPSPNTSGTGPVFSTKGIDTTSPQFRAAQIKCQSVLRRAFPGRRGAGRTGTNRGGT